MKADHQPTGENDTVAHIRQWRADCRMKFATHRDRAAMLCYCWNWATVQGQLGLTTN